MKPSPSTPPAPRHLFSLRRFLPAALALTPLAVLTISHAVPTGAQVAAGTVTVAQAGASMTLTQSSRHAIVNWQSFSLGAGESLRLAQPGADSALLARVTGGDPSQLLGSLHADGKFFLINPRGIVVGRDAVIDTAGFVASTLDVRDADFLRGTNLVFKGDSAAGIVNLGTITAREGHVLLFAHSVNNAGHIAAPQGTAALGAGTEVHLASPDSSAFAVKLNLGATAERTGVENTGVIAAAQARLEAAGGSIYDLAVNQSGVVRATGVKNENGRVLLTAAGGTVGVSGQVTARNADGSGGEILVGGDFQGKNPAVANAARTVVTATATLDASAASPAAKAGRAVVWADDSTRFLGTLQATGAGGGFAEVSGRRWLDFNPAAPVQLGRDGTLLLDPTALVISTAASSGTSTSGTNPFVFGATTEPATLNVTTLQNQLALTNVTLDTSTSGGDITVNSAVTWATNHTLRLQAGGNLKLNANLTGGAASTLALYPGRTASAPDESGLTDISGDATLLSGATVTVGTLTFGANTAAAPTGGYLFPSPARGGTFTAYGNLSVGTLQIDLAGGQVGVSTQGSNNAIGAFRTTGSGPLSTTYVVDHQGGLDVTLNSTASDSTTLQFITPGALTLKSGSSVNFPTSGTVVLASTGGAFVNQAGASAFGTKARYLIYTSTPAATTRGGLTPTYVFNTAFNINSSPAPYTDDSISRIIYSGSRATLTLTSANVTRTYGDANPAFSVNGSGFVDGDTLATAVAGTAALSTTATTASGVGTYSITSSAGTLTSSFYSLAFAPGTLTVNKAPLTISVSSAMTKNQGDPNPNFANFTSTTGLKLAETLATAVPDLAFSTTATTASPAGTYAVNAGGTSANYALTFNSGQLTVAAASLPLLTYAANNLARTYGAANPAFTFTRSGLVLGVTDDVTGAPALSTTATQSSGVGTYALSITRGTLASANYDFAFTPGTLTVNQAPLTVTATNATRSYGAANPAFGASFAGLVNGDTSSVVSGLSLATTATAASGVGTYAITPSGGTATNYAFTYVPGTLSIGRAPLTATIGSYSRVFGDNNPAFSFLNVSGFVNGDTAAVLSGASFSTPAVPASIPAVYAVTGTATAANYALTVAPGLLVVGQRPLFLTAPNVSTTIGSVPTSFAVSGAIAPITGGPQFTITAATNATNSSPAGTYAITPVVRSANGLPDPLFGLYYDLRPTAGVLTLTNPPLPSVLTSLNPTQLGSPVTLTLNRGSNTINPNVTVTPDQQVTVKKNEPLKIAATPVVAFDTKPLTRAEFANYFSTFAATMPGVKSALKTGYDKFLQGYGKSGTAYSAMSPEGRALLADWMAGRLSDAALQQMIATSVAGAGEAFGFILPTLVATTRAKDISQMTTADRDILGRLADITEKQRADTVRLAQQKYEKMVAGQAAKLAAGTLDLVFRGTGDFTEIVQSARQEALAASIGIAAGAGAGAATAGTIALQLVPVLNAIFIHEGSTAAALGGAGAVPAIVIFFVTTLASRSIQINESLKNEEAFRDFVGSFRNEPITSIAQLKSPAMSEELKLSTLLLSAEFLATSRP